MSVIPLRTEGQSPTLLTNQELFRIEGNAILCNYIDEAQTDERSNDCNISYDLRVGKIYRDHRVDGGTNLASGQKIKIAPGMAVIIETEEWIHLPKGVFGQISPKVSLLQKGISNTHSKIDPGYNGPLLVTVFNLGKKTVALERGQKFCSVFFVRVEEGVRPYNKGSKQIEGRKNIGIVQRLFDIIQSNAGPLAIAAMVISVF